VDGQSHRDAINTELADIFTTNTTQGSMTTGSFAYTEPELRTIIKNWLDLADSYDLSVADSLRMTIIEGPGRDFASQMFAAVANQSGGSCMQYLTHNRDYCLQQAQLFQNALDDYLDIEHTNVIEINKSDQQRPHRGV
jgi:hypothetical protein